MRKKILIFYLTFYCFIIYCQSYPNPFETNSVLTINSPQASGFMRYGNINTKVGTGELELNLPLLSIPTNQNQKLEITLAYNSNGFIPSKSPSIVGFDWSLIVGGVINRKVNGIPDDHKSSSPQTKFHGFLQGTRIYPKNKECFYDFSCLNIGGLNYGIGDLNNATNRYEGEPDLFSFNFMGYSGEFMIGNDGVPVVKSSRGNLSVDILNMTTMIDNTIPIYTQLPSSLIKIKDDKGIVYTFGQNYNSIEYTFYQNKENIGKPGLGISPVILNSWYLCQIDYPNSSDDVKFTYEPLDTSNGTSYKAIETNQANKKFLRTFRFNSVSGHQSNGQNCSTGNCGFSFTDQAESIYTQYQSQKRVFLKEISYKNTKIKFNYEDRNYKFYGDLYPTKNGNEIALKTIVLTNEEIPVKNIQFQYNNFGNTLYKRHFLTSFNINNEEQYNFEYYKNENFPPPNTTNIDHWGYWQGGYSLIPVYPSHNINISTGDYSIEGTERNPNFSYVDVGLLKKVQYPTKGYSIFNYDANTYSQRLQRTSQTNFLPGLITAVGSGGGMRVMGIENYDFNNNLVEKTEFKYTTKINNNVSSGILMSWPRYVYAYNEYSKNNVLIATKVYWNSSSIVVDSFDQSNVYYTSVFEIKNGKGYIEHLFSNYEDFPDDNSNLQKFKYLGLSSENDIINMYRPHNLVKNLKSIILNSKSNFRYLPKKDSYFKENSIFPEKTLEYFYDSDFDFNIQSKYNVTNHNSSFFYSQNYKTFFNVPNLIKTITKDYSNNGIIQNIEEKSYDPVLQNNLKISNFDDGTNKIRNEYKYAKDFGDTGDLITWNFLGIPLQTLIYKNNIPISKTNLYYSRDWLGHEGLYPLSRKSVTNPEKIGTNNENMEEDITYDQYDNKGNLLQYTMKNGIPVTIIYGYNRTLPIAKIEGINYISLMNAMGLDDNLTNYELLDICQKSNADASDTEAGNPKEQLLIDALDNFRKQNPTYQITTYTYDPLIGVRSITPPSGIREIYTYDNAHRLKEVKDVNGVILKSNEYHYKNP